MRVEIKETGTKELYREIVNVLMQHRKLIRDPEASLTDNFSSFRKTGIAAAALFAVSMLCGFLFGWGRPVFICTAILWACGAMLLAYVNKMNKAVNSFLEDKRSSVIILDEKGVALSKDGSLVIRLAWDKVAFVRSFSESTCFVPEEELGVVIYAPNAYRDEIREFIGSSNAGVRTVW